MNYGRGYKPDPAEVVARRPGFHLLRDRRALKVAIMPTSVDWSPYVIGADGPGILNQGQTGSCTGHATAGGITTRFAIENAPIRLVSPIGCYTVGRRIGQQPNPDGSIPPLADDGAEPSQVIAGISEWGVCSAEAWGSYPADPATINNEPDLQQLEAVSEFTLRGAYFLQSQGDQFVKDLMLAIASGFPVTAAVAASDPLFNDYTGGILGAMGGGLDHYVYACGFEWDGTDPRSVVVKYVNSWGSSWGESGFFRANRGFIDQTMDCAVFDVLPSGNEV